MKSFGFALDRVLAWRTAQMQREEMKLEQLFKELRALDGALALIHRQRQQAEDELRARPKVEGKELSALDAFQQHAAAERARIAQARAGCEQRIAAQLEVLTAHRRNVKLLEKLKQQRRTAWSREQDREIAQLAEEAHLAKWTRENIQ